MYKRKKYRIVVDYWMGYARGSPGDAEFAVLNEDIQAALTPTGWELVGNWDPMSSNDQGAYCLAIESDGSPLEEATLTSVLKQIGIENGGCPLGDYIRQAK